MSMCRCAPSSRARRSSPRMRSAASRLPRSGASGRSSGVSAETLTERLARGSAPAPSASSAGRSGQAAGRRGQRLERVVAALRVALRLGLRHGRLAEQVDGRRDAVLPQLAQRPQRGLRALADDEAVRHVLDAGRGGGAERGAPRARVAHPHGDGDRRRRGLDLAEEAGQVAREVVERAAGGDDVDEAEQGGLELRVLGGELHRLVVGGRDRVARTGGEGVGEPRGRPRAAVPRARRPRPWAESTAPLRRGRAGPGSRLRSTSVACAGVAELQDLVDALARRLGAAGVDRRPALPRARLLGARRAAGRAAAHVDPHPRGAGGRRGVARRARPAGRRGPGPPAGEPRRWGWGRASPSRSAATACSASCGCSTRRSATRSSRRPTATAAAAAPALTRLRAAERSDHALVGDLLRGDRAARERARGRPARARPARPGARARGRRPGCPARSRATGSRSAPAPRC